MRDLNIAYMLWIILIYYGQSQFCVLSPAINRWLSLVYVDVIYVRKENGDMGILSRLFGGKKNELTVEPIARERMDLLWFNPDEWGTLELAIKDGTPVFVGPEKGGPKEIKVTIEGLEWIKQVDRIAAKAVSAAKQGNFSLAIQHYKDALKLAPGTDLYLMSIGSCLANQKKISEALPYLQRAHEISPNNQRILDNLNSCKQALGMYVEKPNPREVKTGMSDNSTEKRRQVPSITEDTIVNIWAVVDQKTASWLKQHDQSKILSIGIDMVMEIADDINLECVKWMEKTGYGVTILLQEPFDPKKAVSFVKDAGKRSPEETQVVQECKCFLMRTGHIANGGRVGIIIGMNQDLGSSELIEQVDSGKESDEENVKDKTTSVAESDNNNITGKNPLQLIENRAVILKYNAPPNVFSKIGQAQAKVIKPAVSELDQTFRRGDWCSKVSPYKVQESKSLMIGIILGPHSTTERANIVKTIEIAFDKHWQIFVDNCS